MRVALIFNQKSDRSFSEHELEWDSPETIQSVLGAISSQHEVIPIHADQNIFHKLQASKIDIIFNIAEGTVGRNRESHVPAIAEYLGIPYTGSDSLTLGLCLDKIKTKEILHFYQIPTPRFAVVEWEQGDHSWSGPFPAVVKPAWQGSSMGIHDDCWVENKRDLSRKIREIRQKIHEPLLIEEALAGSEFTAALMGNGRDLCVLPLVEVLFDALPQGAHPIYSYEAKWIWDVEESPLEIFQCPARISVSLKMKIEALAKKTFCALECRDWCRIDIRLDEDKNPCILELNPLPGILPDPRQNSCFPKAARAAGLSYQEMILKVLSAAMKRWGLAPHQNLTDVKRGMR